MRALVFLVAVVALGAVAFYTIQTYPPVVEADLKQRSSDALAAANLTFAKVDVAGRVITLSGEAPSPTAKEDAVKVAGDVWGVRNVNDALVVNSTASQPVAPQAVIGHVARVSDQPSVAPPSSPHEETPSPADAEPPSAALPTVEAMIDPALAPPVDTGPAEPTLPSPPVAPPIEAKPAPSETAAAITPHAPSTAVPAPALPPAASAPTAAVTQGVTAGLTAAVHPPAPAPPLAPAVVLPPVYRLEAHVEGKRIELQGVVSTPSAQRALVAHVRRHIRRAQIVDSLTVAHTKPDRDWLGVARTGLSQLAHLDTGSLRLDGRTVAISGRPKSDDDRASVLAALNELPSGYTSTVLLERKQDVAPPTPAVVALVSPPVEAPKHAPARSKPIAASYRTASAPAPATGFLSAACRRRFGDVLPRVAVVFESGSSRVQSTAAAALDEFARAARNCPGARVRLTGHSDTEEVPPRATRLSRERALAVREALAARGISRANVSVAGSGGTRPAFSNNTADGRENNRRVEFSVW